MDASFEILVPKHTRFTHFNFEIPYFEWGGVNYAQGLPECRFGDVFMLKFEELYKVGSFYESLPDRLRNVDWQAIWIEGDGFDNFWSAVVGIGQEKPGYSLQDMLCRLLDNVDAWVVIYGSQCDGFAYWKYGNLEDIVPELQHSMRNTYEGFLMYHG